MKALLQDLHINHEPARTSAIRPPKTRASTRRRLLAGVLLLMAVTIGSWFVLTTRPLPVEVLTVASLPGDGAPATVLTAGGYVKDPKVVYVAPRVAGRILSLRVREGDVVRAGDLIAVIDSRDLDQEAAEAKANYQFAAANLRKLQLGSRPEQIAEARANMQAAALATERWEREFARTKALFDAGIVSAQVLDQAQTDARVGARHLEAMRQSVALLEAGPRQEEIQAAQAAVGAAQARWNTATNRLGYANVLAPVSGRVLRKFRNVGDFVSPDVPFLEGYETLAVGSPVVSLADLSQQEVSADINETDIAKVSLHQAVEISPNAYPREVLWGWVTQVSPRADKNKNTVEVKVTMEKSSRLLPYDMSVKLSFLGQATPSGPQRIRVPASAVVERDGKQFVFVVAGSRAALRAVNVGAAEDQMVSVNSGLADGDRVIVGSSGVLADGARVRPK